MVRDGRLLVVSKQAAPSIFNLPGGKPEPGESLLGALRRELQEELSVGPSDVTPFTVVEALAAIEAVPMRMTVYLAELDGVASPGAELAAMGWTSGRNDGIQLAPAVRDHVIPALVDAGLLVH
ncbi:hypothetical protein GCM10009804_58450 [Kribbella hippodromi]|uniref:Nudix hydrolase domain-containing protein n=1 Tax=Kribbella hippodromi TaxID=434347 RepID=A0ABP4PZ63_9ACTN